MGTSQGAQLIYFTAYLSTTLAGRRFLKNRRFSEKIRLCDAFYVRE
jgi:hypothetical protein